VIGRKIEIVLDYYDDIGLGIPPPPVHSTFPKKDIGTANPYRGNRPVELAELAYRSRLSSVCSTSSNIKDTILIAKQSSIKGRELLGRGELEAAFFELVKSAELIRCIRAHQDYHINLTLEERNDVVVRDLVVFEDLYETKAALDHRYRDWVGGNGCLNAPMAFVKGVQGEIKTGMYYPSL